MYVVLGATGNTGSVAVRNLLMRGQKVRAVARDPRKAQELTNQGAVGVVADVNDSAVLVKVLEGASAAYVMLPPRAKDPDLIGAGNHMSTAITDAISKSGIQNVVLLSSVGAQLENKTGPIQCLHVFEEKLKQVKGLNTLSLRPGPFMENFLMLISLVKSMGMLAGGIDGKLKMSFIATRDIGVAAANALVNLDFSGFETRELHGQRDLSHDEVATAIGAGIGKPKLSYTKFPAFIVEQGMKQLGIPGKTASLMSEMNDAVNDGLLQPLEPRSVKNTTPTSIEDWVKDVFSPAYAAMN